MAPSERPVVSSQILALVVAVFGVLATIVYLPSVHSLPSADDFLAPAIVRIESVHGLAAFFWRSPMDDYRPLQWIVAAVTVRPATDVFAALHLLTLASFIPYALVLVLWVRHLRLSAAGAACAIAVVFLHPVLAGPLGELDAFSRFLTSAPMWLGVLAADRYARRLPLAIGAAALCLAVALGFTEYAVGLVVMAPIAVFAQRSERKVIGAAAMGAAMVTILAAYLVMRHVATRGLAGASISLNPTEWGRNALMMTAALLYPGNSIAIALGTQPSRYILLAAGCGLVAVWLGIGLQLSRSREGTREPASLPYLFALLAASYVPMFARSHLSEIYLTAPVFVFGLLMGRAAEGWSAVRLVRPAAFACLAALLAWGLTSAVSKQRAIAARGQRADRLIQSLLESVPPGTRDATVWLVFAEEGRRYSTFVSGDDYLIQPEGPAQRAATWFWPGRHIRLKHVIGTQVMPAISNGDIVLCWSAEKAAFRRTDSSECAASLVR